MNGEHIYNIAHLAIEEIASNLNNDMQSSINYNPHSNPVDEIMNDGQPTTHSIWDAWESILEVLL